MARLGSRFVRKLSRHIRIVEGRLRKKIIMILMIMAPTMDMNDAKDELSWGKERSVEIFLYKSRVLHLLKRYPNSNGNSRIISTKQLSRPHIVPKKSGSS